MLDSNWLIEFLEEVEPSLPQEITLVAAGGTALTPLGIKESTIDVDLTGPKGDIAAFRKALESVPHGAKFDLYADGAVFSQLLPKDYLSRAKRIKRIGRIDLRALHPVDIIVTKAGRLDERDMEDIEACFRKFSPSRREIEERGKQVEYVGHEETYRLKLDEVIRRLFDRRPAKARR